MNPYRRIRGVLLQVSGRYSIRTRIVAFFSALIGVISLFIYLYFPAAIEQQAMIVLRSKAEGLAIMAAHNVSSAVVFQDERAIGESLEGALQNQDVDRIEVTDIDGVILASMSTGNRRPGLREAVNPGEMHRHDAPILFDGSQIGSVQLDLSLSELHADVAEARTLVAIVSLLVFLVGYSAASLIGRHITRPLADVASVAERIAEGDLNTRAKATTSDEVGQLARSFNRMIDRLQAAQDSLLQSQKMESIGKLAGGIAHDFNNMLTTITGSADLVLMDLAVDDPSREDIEEIQRAAGRAASLTSQLLAFSRQQINQPTTLDLNQAVRGVEEMLRRTIGESIRFATDLEGGTPCIRADKSQVEQVILNLVVNARDAMPQGGAVTIRTHSEHLEEDREGDGAEPVPAGHYVVLTVTDTGVGMDAETIRRIFEPFFTKKAPGQGTGLGLATAYGVVQQAGGYIRVYSELGMGSSFKIYMPRVEHSSLTTEVTPEEIAPRGSERILVVEDQEDVRAISRKILERCGYRVTIASSGRQAIEMIRQQGDPFDLLLTDVVMPEISGPELVSIIAPLSPLTVVVYMSGYTDDQLQHHGVLDEGISLIEKPFTRTSLARTVRAALDQKASRQLVQMT